MPEYAKMSKKFIVLFWVIESLIMLLIEGIISLKIIEIEMNIPEVNMVNDMWSVLISMSLKKR